MRRLIPDWRPPARRGRSWFSYRGVDLDALLDMSSEDLVQPLPARARRVLFELRSTVRCSVTDVLGLIRFASMVCGLVRFSRGKRKPMALVKKLRKAVEIKPEMIGHYLAEFSLSKPVKHRRPGIGATHSSGSFPSK
ncbi:hypothetical protein QYE76_061229 [Lolium multiflorum]|uniref:Uncharacterized protein n=1 Tax=Lolium multiflorum TaxID=4521 RepID=A0AAD8S0K7_LOLMU|nr:hypothetical protein QYE76_061229 [Lolium multiflorum]